MEDVRELHSFDADLDVMSEEEEGDPAAAVDPPMTRRRRGDHLPKKDLLKKLWRNAVEVGLKAAAKKGTLM